MRRIIPLSHLLSFKSVYREDANWAAMLVEFQASPAHWLTIQQLVRELRSNRFFRDPIYVGKDEEVDLDSFWVFDGTHRTCAYLLAGASEVEVAFESEYEDEWINPQWLVETEIIGKDGYAMEDPEDDDRTTSLWTALMSLRLNDQVWLTSNISSSDGERILILWADDAEEVSDGAINLAAKAKLTQLGFDTARLQVVTRRTLLEE